MALTTDDIYYYAAGFTDFENAVSVANQFGVLESHVLQSFTLAYALVKSGSAMVIAVGEPAANALAYNPCGWAHYGSPGFTWQDTQLANLPGAGVFMNADGVTGLDSENLAKNCTIFALNDSAPVPREIV